MHVINILFFLHDVYITDIVPDSFDEEEIEHELLDAEVLPEDGHQVLALDDSDQYHQVS